MDYSERLEADIRELERATRAAAMDETGETTGDEVAAAVGTILDTYPVPEPAIRGYTAQIRAFYRSHEQTLADRVVEAEREILLSDICSDYDPVLFDAP